MNARRTGLAVAMLSGLLSLPAGAAPQQGPPVAPCAEDAEYRTLDFWVGSWDVFAASKRVGTNRIERILGGCALRELWTGADGRKGESLFYYVKATKQWKQVWVTESASAPGGVKEKRLVRGAAGGEVLFQGEIPLAGGGSYLDRTALTPRPDGKVRQLIEISKDGGTTWEPVFDALYVRRP